MNFEMLLAQLDELSREPRAVAQLRRFILELGTRGSLADHDPDAEPASEILSRIEAEIARMIANREIRPPKPLAPIPPALRPSRLPSGWEIVRAGSLLTFVTSGSRGWAEYYSNNGAVFLRIGNLDYGTTDLDLSDVQHVRPPFGTEGARTLVAEGDILISITGDTGMVGLVPRDFPEAYINQHIALARPSKQISSRYLATYFSSPTATAQLHGRQRGLKNSLGLDDIRHVVVALPPLVEQERIVDKVSELMALCDDLEDALTQREDARSRLLESVLTAALSNGDVSNTPTDQASRLDCLPIRVSQLRAQERPTLFESVEVHS